MYEDFSRDYDRFVDWTARLETELPFIEEQLQRVYGDGGRKPSVLDSACGTGMHAIALARRGYRLVGADLSPTMVEQARQNAAEAGVDIRFEIAPLGQMAAVFGQQFDGLLCLGNSLPHLLDVSELQAALRDMARCIRPGGLLMIQNRNFDDVLGRGLRWMEPQGKREGDCEWVFVRFYDFDADGLITFHVLTLRREGFQPWSQRQYSTRLMPMRWGFLIKELVIAGFHDIMAYGDMHASPFEEDSSPNLILTGLKTV